MTKEKRWVTIKDENMTAGLNSEINTVKFLEKV